MPFITHYYDTPGDNTYDPLKIDIDGAAILLPDKTQTSGLWQLNGPGNIAVDESPNGYDFNYTGATAQWVAGRVGNAWQPEGGNYFVAPNNTWYNFNSNSVFSIMAWFKKSNDGQAHFFFVKKQSGSPYRGYGFMLNTTGRIQIFLTYLSSKELSVQTNEIFNDGNWHQVFICYDGSATAAGVDIYVDNILRTKGIINDTLSTADDITTTIPASIGGPSGTSPWTDLLDQVIIWNTCLSTNIINYMYNSGVGREIIPRYINPAPDIFKKTGHAAPIGDNARYTGFSVNYSLQNEGVAGIHVSIDGGITWLVYDSVTMAWKTAGAEPNTVATVNSNIISIADPPLPANINIKVFLISDQGFEEVQLINYTITYTEGLAPEIIIGPGKTSFDNEEIIPFETTTFSDPDGTVIKAEWRSYLIIQESITPQDGTSNTIYLSASANPTNDFYNGNYVYCNQEFHLIIDYIGSTKLATIVDTWETIPTNGDFYSVGEEIEPNWFEIDKGIWASLQEAVQNFKYSFRTDGPALTALRLYLKVSDDDFPQNSTTDSKVISVNPYTITIDVRDPQQIPLTDFLFTPGDGRPQTTEDSPFSILYAYGNFIMIVDKDDYITTNQLIQVRATGVTEFIVLNQNLTLANLDQIWRVILADVQDPGSVGSALGAILNILAARPSSQVPLTVADVTWLNRLKACNVFRVLETPLITLRGDEDLTNVDGPFFEVIPPDGIKREWPAMVNGYFASYQVLNGELDQTGTWRIRIVADNLGAFQGGTGFTPFTVIGEND